MSTNMADPLSGETIKNGEADIHYSTSTAAANPEKEEPHFQLRSDDSTGSLPVPARPGRLRRFMVLVAMSMLWIASQIPLYLYGAVIPKLVADLGGGDRAVWVTLSYFVPLAAVTPFVGQLSDLMGRRNLSLAAAGLLVVGNIVCATAHTMNHFIAGMALIGCGAGVLELTALAVAGEMAPVQKRGLYIGSVTMTVIPYAPSVLYAQWVASYSWRWLCLWIGGWGLVGLLLTALCFHPAPRSASAASTSPRQILASMDYVGGFLSTAGFTLFLASLTWGGTQYPWSSAHVLAPLVLGVALVIAFGFWEVYGAKHPIFPHRLRERSPRTLLTIFTVTAVSGAVFFTILICWPTQYSYVYAINGDPVSIGLGSLPIAFCFLGGAFIASAAMSYWKRWVRTILVTACVVMTAGNGALAAARVDNLYAMFAPLVLTCLGCGAVITPCQIVATIVSPDDLIATVIALTITIRFVGGSVGLSIYNSIQMQELAKTSVLYIGDAARSVGIQDAESISQVIMLLTSGRAAAVRDLLQTDAQWETLLAAARQAYAASYSPVYYCAVGFGVLAIAASLCMPDISDLMDQHVAVAY